MKIKRLKKAGIILLLIICLFFNMVKANTEDEEDININEILQVTSAEVDMPKTSSRIALIYDRASGEVIYEKNGYRKAKMASTTKIMTSLIVLEKGNLSDTVTVSKKAAGTGGSRLGLKTNDKITVNDLLMGLMLESGNDAAIALAEHIGDGVEKFADLMNAKAKELGLKNTHFAVPHGLDNEEHYTTALELAKITDYALKIEKFRNIVATKEYNVTINGYNKVISNTNELLGSLDGVYGVKTGFTNGAGRCLVTSCKRGELDIITIVLGADTKKIRTTDSINLINYAYKNYKVMNIENIINQKFEEWKNIREKAIIVNKGILENATIKLGEFKYTKRAIRNADIDNINIEANCLMYLEAPVEANNRNIKGKSERGNNTNNRYISRKSYKKKRNKRLFLSNFKGYILTFGNKFAIIINSYAKVAQLVECNLAKVDVAGSSPVFRSKSAIRKYRNNLYKIKGDIAKW